MKTVIALAATFSLAALLAAPASADTVGLSIGPSVTFQSAARQIGGTTQLNLGASFDIGPSKPLPVRASVVFDYAGGSANGGSLSNYGGGFGVRLTTPIYAGVNGLFYNVSLSPGGGFAGANRVGFGTNYFIGERIAQTPGGGSISLQATYRQLPIVNGIDPSGLGVSVRVGF